MTINQTTFHNTKTEITTQMLFNLPFKTQQFVLQFKQQNHTFLSPQNPDDVLDSLTEQQYEKDHFLPYWAEQWPSSEILISFLESQKFRSGIKMIELGCGLGIISSLMASNGHSIVATDISFDALIFTKANAALNKGNSLPCCIDWRSLPFKVQFDQLIASDILYESRWIEPILNCCQQLISTNGKAWIADPCRSFWEEFKDRAQIHGFKCNVIHREQTNREKKHTIEIFELRKC